MIPSFAIELSIHGDAPYRGSGDYPSHSCHRGEVGAHSLALVEIILHQPVKRSRLRLSRVERFTRRKKEREKKEKKKKKDENFCFTMVREQAEEEESMKHPRCTFIGSHEQIYSCDAIPSYSRA